MDSFKLASLPLPRLRVAALLVIVRVVHVFLQLQAATAYGRGVQTSGGAIPSGFHLANGNGRVFDLPITVNLLFYGDWFDKSSKGKVEKARLEKFVTSLSDTGGTIKDWWQAVSKNYVGSNGPVSTKVSPTTSSKATPSRNQLPVVLPCRLCHHGSSRGTATALVRAVPCPKLQCTVSSCGHETLQCHLQ